MAGPAGAPGIAAPGTGAPGTGASLSDRIAVVGFGHRTCAAPLRERLYVEDAAVPAALAALAASGIGQALILSTCDRIELQAVSDRPIGDVIAAFAATLSSSVALQ